MFDTLHISFFPVKTYTEAVIISKSLSRLIPDLPRFPTSLTVCKNLSSRRNLALVTPRSDPANGTRTDAAGKLIGNKVLLSLSETEFRRIREHLEFQELPARLNLHEPNEKQNYAYFLNRGLASIVVATTGSRDVEAGVVGCEGIVGTAIAVGLWHSPLRVVMQISGDGFRITSAALRTVLATAPDLQLRLGRYAVLQGMQVAQTAACNRLHEVDQRLARWLLMAEDRIGKGVLPITHDFLATMLGTDRPSVSIAARALQDNAAIKYGRGAVEVVDRNRLESLACACYSAVQQLNGYLGLKEVD